MTDGQLIAVVAVVLAGSAVLGMIVGRPTVDVPSSGHVDLTDAMRRRRDARRFNEQIKLFATFLNGIGVAVLITLVVAPLASTIASVPRSRALLALFAAIVLHMSAQLILRLWKSEE